MITCLNCKKEFAEDDIIINGKDILCIDCNEYYNDYCRQEYDETKDWMTE